MRVLRLVPMPGRAILMTSIMLMAASSVDASPPRRTATRPGRTAVAFFQRDWVLMNWALRFYDGNGDVALSPGEAAPAAKAFRKIADRNKDGRITPAEYRMAREFILSRY